MHKAQVKIGKYLVRLICEHPQKEIALMFGTKTVGPCLVRKLQWRAMSPLAPPVATPLLFLLTLK